MTDKEKRFLKWCESMPKDYMKFLWRLWLSNYAMDDFLTGKTDTFSVSTKGVREPEPFRDTPPISDEYIMKIAQELNISAKDFDKIMKKKTD